MADKLNIVILLGKLSGRKVELSTMDGTFNRRVGFVKEVYSDFFTFITVEEKFADKEATRHWIPFTNIAVISEYNKKGTSEKLDIER